MRARDDFLHLREAAAQYGGGQKDHAEHHDGAYNVRLQRNVAVAKAGAREDLQENDGGVERDDGVDRRRALIFILRADSVPTSGW